MLKFRTLNADAETLSRQVFSFSELLTRFAADP